MFSPILEPAKKEQESAENFEECDSDLFSFSVAEKQESDKDVEASGSFYRSV